MLLSFPICILCPCLRISVTYYLLQNRSFFRSQNGLLSFNFHSQSIKGLVTISAVDLTRSVLWTKMNKVFILIAGKKVEVYMYTYYLFLCCNAKRAYKNITDENKVIILSTFFIAAENSRNVYAQSRKFIPAY